MGFYHPLMGIICAALLFASTYGFVGCHLIDKKRLRPDDQEAGPPPPPPTPTSPQGPQQTTSCPLPEVLPVEPAQRSTLEAPLKSLSPIHPRLHVTPQRLTQLKNLLSSGDPTLLQYVRDLSVKVAEIEKRAPLIPQRDVSENARLISSPEARERITFLAGHYLLTGNEKSGREAIAAMKAVASFSDWNPSHFLDTSVMAYAVAIGYDWTYDLLSPDERQLIKDAILNKGIRPAIDQYQKQTWWTKTRENWPLVNGGAVGIAALAVAESDPEVSTEVLQLIVKNIENPLTNYAPDGAWPEGPMYWGYGSMYLFGFLDGLMTSLGTDFGLSERPGLADSGFFRVFTTGPTKRPFSFYDTGEGIGSADFMHWLARRYQKPYLAQLEKSLSGLASMTTILWYAQGCLDPAVEPPHLSKIYPRLHLANLRTNWDAKEAIYIGFKGGSNKTSHGHLDLGSFVLDADGERWAIDLGGDAYTVPGYFDSRLRQNIYRISTQAHNTLTLSREIQKPLAMPNQPLDGKAPIIAFKGDEEWPRQIDPMQQRHLPERYAVSDLTEAYAPLVSRALRGIGILPNRTVILMDELKSQDGPIWAVSHFHTRAKIDVKGSLAILTNKSSMLRLKILSPKDAFFEIVSANPRDLKPTSSENINQDVKDLVIRTKEIREDTTLVLWMVPGLSNPTSEPELGRDILPLSQWIQAAPVF